MPDLFDELGVVPYPVGMSVERPGELSDLMDGEGAYGLDDNIGGALMPYSSMEDVNLSVKGITPPVTLAQANGIAVIADKLEEEGGVDSPWAVAISQFKKSHVVKDDKWVKKEGSEFGKKSWLGDIVGRFKATVAGKKQGGADDDGEGAFTCECLECGHTMTTDEHCVDVKCPECGGEMRRAERPGPGKFAGAEMAKPGGKGVKAIERGGSKYLILWTSNAFEDREREIFSTKAWENYVGRVDQSGNYGRVWFWHVKGSDFADITWVDMVGHILVEVAKIDNTPRGDKMFHALQHPEEHPALLPIGWGTSHGYVYKAGDKEDGIYNYVHKFETTVLPLHVAANLYGGIKGVIDMTVTDEKVVGLAAILGEEEAGKVLTDAGVESDARVKAGVSFKEDKPVPPKKEEEEEEEEGTPPEEGEEGTPPKKKLPPVPPKKEEEEKSQGQYFELEMDDDLLKEIASHVNVDVSGQVEAAIKELTDDLLKVVKDAAGKAAAAANVASKEQIVQQALSGKLRLKPYVASKDAGNIVPPSEVVEADKSGAENPVAAVVKRMLSGV